MKTWAVVLFYGFACFGQTTLTTNIDEFVGVDFYQNYYYLKQGSLFKSSLQNDYQNIQYGSPNVVDISNPLQVLLYYPLFNKLIVLDNQLNFLTEFDTPIGTAFIANAGKNKVWIYNNIKSVIELYNLNHQKVEISSLPLQHKVIALKGNLNEVMAVNTQSELITYNYVARKIKHQNIVDTKLPISLQEPYKIIGTSLYQGKKKILKLMCPIDFFEVINNQLYFFEENSLKTLSISKN